ncbi:MAG: AI-2E family transporter [Clostridia bacterium]|nr:AI-2E family transporter [Clostridia bacterium]
MENNRRRQSLTWLIGIAIFMVVLLYSRTIIQGISGIVELFRPFLLGIIIAFILSQPYEQFRRLYIKKCRRKAKTAHVLAILSAYLLIIAVFAAVVGVVIPQLISSIQLFAQNVEYYLRNLQLQLDTLTQQLHLTEIDLSSVMNLVQAGLGQFDNAVVPKILSVTGTMLSSLATLAIAIAFSVYLLAGKKRILSQFDRILQAYLSADIYEHMRYVLKVIVESFRNYVIGQSIEAVILGGLCFIGMFLLRLDYAGMVSMVVAITALIPILGAYIGGAVAVVLLLMVSPMKAVIFLLFFVILQQVENNVIYPRVVGGRIGLPGIWVLLAITVGGKIGGIVGMLFGVPTTTILYTLLRNSVRTREKRKRI